MQAFGSIGKHHITSFLPTPNLTLPPNWQPTTMFTENPIPLTKDCNQYGKVSIHSEKKKRKKKTIVRKQRETTLPDSEGQTPEIVQA